MTRIGKAIAR